ncbi:MAG: ABC transporter ATP-binding protein [Gammaproteobacteria bacterium]|nr:ABC transporter ATP-binding protein [Gammaproteobacteria bacterium]
MTGELVEFERVGKMYHVGDSEVHALEEVSLSLEVGDFVSVIGPSGSGKSTFMNLCGCLDTPTRGRVIIDGVDVAGMTDDALAELRNQKLGFVFQQFNLLPRTTSLDNVALPLLYAGVKRKERHRKARQVMALVGLSDRMEHHPSQLSGGQQQRVAIARALVNDPVLLLADEPTGALDTRTGAEIMALFQQLNNRGISIVLVTHEQDIAAAARRRLTFRDGRVIEDRTIEQLRFGQPDARERNA